VTGENSEISSGMEGGVCGGVCAPSRGGVDL
jgi:hypothetical protein